MFCPLSGLPPVRESSFTDITTAILPRQGTSWWPTWWRRRWRRACPEEPKYSPPLRQLRHPSPGRCSGPINPKYQCPCASYREYFGLTSGFFMPGWTVGPPAYTLQGPMTKTPATKVGKYQLAEVIGEGA